MEPDLILANEFVGGMSWAKTTQKLRAIRLCVLNYQNILCCLHCRDPYILLTPSSAVEHAASHRPSNSRKPTKSEIKAIIAEHRVFSNSLELVPTPLFPASPFPFLEEEPAWRCTFGDDTPCNAIVRPSYHGAHYTQNHPKHSREKQYMKITVQSFSKSPRNDFEVVPQSNITRDEVNFPRLPTETDPAILTAALRSQWKPLPPLVGTTSNSYRDNSPFLMQTGLGDYVQGWDPEHHKTMLSLIEPPDHDDPLRHIVDETEKLFTIQQTTIHKIASYHRLLVMADKQEPRAFARLDTSASVTAYGQCWGLFLVFVLRVLLRQTTKEDMFGLELLPNQIVALKRLHKQVTDPTYNRDWSYLVLDASFWLWQYNSEEESAFEHIAINRWSDPTLVYCALIALRPGGGFEEPKECGHRWARVSYAIRNAILHFWSREMALGRFSVSVCSRNLKRGLTRVELYPFASVADISSLAKAYGETTTRPPSVIWTTPEELSISGTTIVQIPRWQSGMKHYIDTVLEFWDNVVMMGFTLPQLGLIINKKTRIYDDTSNMESGYSFLNDPRNNYSSLRFSFGDAVLTTPEGGHMHHGVVNNQVAWSDRAVDNYLEKFKTGSLQLSNVVHASCGIPARAPEEASWTVSNGVGRPRNFLVIGPGMVVFMGMYDKTSRVVGYDKPRAHCLPWKIAKTFLAMHILVIPFTSMLIEREAGTAARAIQESLAFPLRGTSLDSNLISSQLQKTFLEYVGAEGMGLRNYRHFSDAVVEAFAPYLKDPTALLTGAGDFQGGHVTLTASIHYGTAAGHTHVMDSQDVLRFRAASLIWAHFFMPEEYFTEEELVDIARAKGNPRPAPSTSPPSISINGQDPMELARLIAGSINLQELAKYMTTNQQAQSEQQTSTVVARSPTPTLQNLRLSSAPSSPNPQSLSRSPTPQPLSSSTSIVTPVDFEENLPPLITKQHKRILRIYTGNRNAEWSCEGQARAFASITQQNRRSVLVVLPTGGGKSFCFMGTPLLEKGLTAVVFPLVALLEDQKRTAERLNITVTKWTPSTPVDTPDGLVFVSVEQVTKAFQSWLVLVRGKKRLIRIVVDEVHKVLEDMEFRDAMRNMRQLVESAVPLVLLTATLPPVLESELIRHMGSPTLRVIRESTQRPNIAYHMARYKDQNLALRALLDHVKRLEDRLLPGEGILICVRAKADVNKVAKHIPGAREWHSEHVDRQANSEQWLAGVFPILVSTSGMATGTHHPAVRGVFHYDLPWGVPSYGQESGRGGRDGKLAWSCIFHSGPDVQAPELKQYNGWETIVEMSKSTKCIRLAMSEYLDGSQRRVTCYSGPFQECGNCLGGNPDRQPILKSWTPVFELPNIPIPEDMDMDIDPTPNTKAQNEFDNNQARQHAAAVAKLASPAHPEVANDARRAVDRRVQEAQQELKAALKGEMNIALLMIIKRWMENRCVYCMVYDFDRSAGHLLDECPVETGLTRYLDPFVFGGDKLSASCRDASLPEDHSACWFCYWPGAKKGLHDGRYGAEVCPQLYQVTQLLWLLRSQPEAWEALKKYFGLKTEVDAGRSYIRWAWTKYRAVNYHKGDNQGKISMINMWRVIMWYISVYKGKSFE